MRVEDVVYLSPEELRRRGLAPPADESRLDDDHAEEPSEQAGHGDTSCRTGYAVKILTNILILVALLLLVAICASA